MHGYAIAMKIWERNSIRNVFWRNPSDGHLAYRMPFYTNMICMGYVFYNEFKFDRYGAMDYWSDATGWMALFRAVGIISWLLAFGLVLFTLQDRRKNDWIGLGYLTCIFAIRLVINWYRFNQVSWFDPH